MKTKEERIVFDMNYCQHYKRGKGADMVCNAGMDLATIKKVPTGDRGILWGPCIEGHTLANPTEHCQHWIRRTREMGEKRADEIEKAITRMTVVMPVVDQWRLKEPFGKREVIECPVCKGKLHLSQAAYNGHVHAKCETEDCVAFME